MRLSAKLLKNVDGLNAFQLTDRWTVRTDGTSAEPATYHLMLIDQDREDIRYIPAAGSTLTVEFPDLDDASSFSIAATNPFADDRSIWAINLLSTQTPGFTVIRITLTEQGVTRRFSLTRALNVEKLVSEGC